jgi:glyoxylase-like metal-dependent hydrolase (beta-lactamase superfamily II)
MLWDTGLPKAEALGKTLIRGPEESEAMASSLVDELAKLGVKPDQISIVGISHYHSDHTGQAADFPSARLLMGKGDLDFVRQAGGARAKRLQPWIGGGGAVEEVTGDKDVFGDGSVTMLDLPGHTPGHHGLLVRLASGKVVLLSGDVTHFRENLATGGVPGFNVDRAKSLASMDRFRALGRNLKAVVIVQHDERDVAKLPAFPQGAE